MTYDAAAADDDDWITADLPASSCRLFSWFSGSGTVVSGLPCLLLLLLLLLAASFFSFFFLLPPSLCPSRIMQAYLHM